MLSITVAAINYVRACDGGIVLPKDPSRLHSSIASRGAVGYTVGVVVDRIQFEEAPALGRLPGCELAILQSDAARVRRSFPSLRVADLNPFVARIGVDDDTSILADFAAWLRAGLAS